MRIGFSRFFYAIAAACLATLSLAYGGFGPTGHPLPGWIPSRETCSNLSAVLLLTASAGLCLLRTAYIAAWVIGAYQGVWAALGTPSILSSPLSIGAWYGFCEATTSLAGAWILCAELRRRPDGSRMAAASERAVRVAQVLFGLTCVFYGASHFAYADYTASMVPIWLPGRLGWAYLTGLGHIAAGVGIVFGILPRLAATLEAAMMGLFGILVWVPSFWAQPRPQWATPPQNQWSELVVNLILAASACIVAASLRHRSWGFRSRSGT